MFSTATQSLILSPIPWPHVLRRGSAAARWLEMRFRIPPGTWKSVSWECCVLSGRDLCYGLITRLEQSYQCGVFDCDREATTLRRSWPTRGCRVMKNNKTHSSDRNMNKRNKFFFLFFNTKILVKLTHVLSSTSKLFFLFW